VTVAAVAHDRAGRITALPAREVVAVQRPRLVVVERGSRVVWLMVGSALMLCFLLFFAAMLRTNLAQQQLKLDQLNRDVEMARDHYNDLRHERTFLASPDRLSSEAAKLGMKPAGSSKYVAIDPEILATVAAATGDLTDHIAKEATSPLDEFGRIKSEVGAAP
jgi:cell division protein FtsL